MLLATRAYCFGRTLDSLKFNKELFSTIMITGTLQYRLQFH